MAVEWTMRELQTKGERPMLTLWLIGTGLSGLVCFAMGYLGGYKQACHAHNWYLPKIDWGKELDDLYAATKEKRR
jgi:hypothetical protein